MTIDVDTLLTARVAAEIRVTAAARLVETAEAELKSAEGALKLAHDDINIALTAEIKRLVDEAA